MNPTPGHTVRKAKLHLTGWFGHTADDVLVVGETPHRYRVKAPPGKRVKLAGRDRWLEGEIVKNVPKHAVSFRTDEEQVAP